MNFFTIVLRGLLRRPVRTGLTLLGISIGIAAVIALVGIARGFEASWTDSLSSRGTDIVVSALGSAFTPAPFEQKQMAKLDGLPHIDAVCPIYVTVTSIDQSPMIIVSAREWEGFSWDNLTVKEGRMPTDGDVPEVVLGTSAIETLGKDIGDEIKIGKEELEIVGIVDGGGSMENGSAFLSLSLMQEITGNEGKINIIDIRLEPDTSQEDSEQLCETIDSRIPDVRAQLASEHVR
ncbi:MAG: ABC transporter permease, partial [Chthoniobacterales bacterium]